MGGLQINFLRDAGLTATFDPQKQPSLQGSDRSLVDVSNPEITTCIYGYAEIQAIFEPMQFTTSSLSGIMNENILGQDFLVKYVHRLDLK